MALRCRHVADAWLAWPYARPSNRLDLDFDYERFSKIPRRGETPHLHRPRNYDESVHAARSRSLALPTFLQVRWPTRICSQVQHLKSGKIILAIVVPYFSTRFRIVNKWPGQEEAAGDSKVEPIIARGEHSLNLTTYRFHLWLPMKVIARLRLVQTPLSKLEQTVYSLRSGSNYSRIVGYRWCSRL